MELNTADIFFQQLEKVRENEKSNLKQELGKNVITEVEQQIREDSHHEELINKIENKWEQIENNNKEHRSQIIGIIFTLIIIEIVFMICFIFMSPFVNFPNHLVEIFSTAVVIQTFGLVTIMLNYLFNNKDDKFLEAISKIYKNNNK